MNIVSRDFTIQDGSTIRFNGDILQKAAAAPRLLYGAKISAVAAWVIPAPLLQSEGNIIEIVPAQPAKTAYRIDWVEIYIGR